MQINVFEGILIPFVGTTLGAACVFFMRKTLSKLLQQVHLLYHLELLSRIFQKERLYPCRLGQRVKVRERHFWEVYFQESLNRLEQ